jgi:hypothetical protein
MFFSAGNSVWAKLFWTIVLLSALILGNCNKLVESIQANINMLSAKNIINIIEAYVSSQFNMRLFMITLTANNDHSTKVKNYYRFELPLNCKER